MWSRVRNFIEIVVSVGSIILAIDRLLHLTDKLIGDREIQL